jgi:ATP-dependent Clp protease ATP-binding subunit ClpC
LLFYVYEHIFIIYLMCIVDIETGFSFNKVREILMAEQLSVQDLYNQAFAYYQGNDKSVLPNALELVKEALALAPDDLNLHALAMNIIDDMDKFADEYISHAEFILDHDVRYNDALNKQGPHDFIDWLFFRYSRAVHEGRRLSRSSGIEPDPVEMRELKQRYIHYGKLVLKAGYGIFTFDSFFETLCEFEHFDDVINIGSVLLGMKSAAEIGMPGIEKTERTEKYNVIEVVADAFYKSRRFKEGCAYLNEVIRLNKGEWIANEELGVFYCNLDKPAETARQWILATRKRGWDDDHGIQYHTLCKLVADPLAAQKYALFHRIGLASKTVTPENKAAADGISNQVYRSIGDREKPLLKISYIENKLGVALPPETEEHFTYHLRKLWVPSVQGEYPYRRKEQGPEAPAAVIPKSVKIDPHTIMRLGIDMTELARSGRMPPIVGRDAEINALVRILLRMEKNNPVLLGEAGVGKTAIIQGLAQRIVSENVPDWLRGRRVFELPMASLVSGTTYRGDFEERMTTIIEEANANPDIVLFVDELHTIMGAGTTIESHLDAANIVKPALAKGSLRLAGATTAREYGVCIEKDQAMARRFTAVRISEMDRNGTVEVLKKRREYWKERQKVEIPDDVLLHAVELVDARIKNRRFPDKAIDILDESCAFARTRRTAHENGFWKLTQDDVQHVFLDWTGGARLSSVKDTGETAKQIPDRKAIHAEIMKKLPGQSKAVQSLTDMLLRRRLSLKDPERPCTLLFYGPAGSGKEAACEVLTGVLWPKETDRLLLLNGAQLADESALFRLIGPPPGYAGFNEGGLLTARLKHQAHSVIVLKNITEAHHGVVNFFIELFQQGYYTDSTGREIAVADTVFIVHFDSTSRSNGMGFGAVSQKQNTDNRISDDLRKAGLPEMFCCAFTFQVQFVELTKEPIRSIIGMRLESLCNEYAGKGIQVRFSDEIIGVLTDAFVKQPADKKDMETQIDKEIGSRILLKILDKTSNGNAEIVI